MRVLCPQLRSIDVHLPGGRAAWQSQVALDAQVTRCPRAHTIRQIMCSIDEVERLAALPTPARATLRELQLTHRLTNIEKTVTLLAALFDAFAGVKKVTKLRTGLQTCRCTSFRLCTPPSTRSSSTDLWRRRCGTRTLSASGWKCQMESIGEATRATGTSSGARACAAWRTRSSR